MAVLNSKQKTKKPRGPARDTIQFRIDIFSDTKKKQIYLSALHLFTIFMDLLWRANEKVGSESPNTLQVPESGQVNIKQTGHKINLFFHLGGGFLFLI